MIVAMFLGVIFAFPLLLQVPWHDCSSPSATSEFSILFPIIPTIGPLELGYLPCMNF